MSIGARGGMMDGMRPPLADVLDLEPHPEGGWFRQTWFTPHTVTLPTVACERPPPSSTSSCPPASPRPGTGSPPTRCGLPTPARSCSSWAAPEPAALRGWRRPGRARSRPHGGSGGPGGRPRDVWQRTVPGDDDALVSRLVSPGFDFADFGSRRAAPRRPQRETARTSWSEATTATSPSRSVRCTSNPLLLQGVQRRGRGVPVVVALADADEREPPVDVVEDAVVAVARPVVRHLEHVDVAPPGRVERGLVDHLHRGLALDVSREQHADPADMHRQHDRRVVGHRAGVDASGRPPDVRRRPCRPRAAHRLAAGRAARAGGRRDGPLGLPPRAGPAPAWRGSRRPVVRAPQRVLRRGPRGSA